MKRFVEYFVLREADGTEAVKGQFEQLRNQIGSMFQVLYRAAQKTWGRGAPALGDKVKAEVISDLEGILAKLKGGGTAPAMKAECFRIANDIAKSLNEADDIVSGLRPTAAAGATGKPVYNMMDVLKNIENKIMQGVAGLEQSVLGQKIDAMHADLGGKTDALGNKVDTGFDKTRASIGDAGRVVNKSIDQLGQDVGGVGADVRRAHGGLSRQVRGVDNKLGAATDDLRGDISGYGQKTLGGLDKLGKSVGSGPGGGPGDVDKHRELIDKLSGIDRKLDSPAQPLTGAARDNAYKSVELLSGLAPVAREHGVKLVHPHSGDEIDLHSLKSARGMAAILGMASKDANFKLYYSGNDQGVPFTLGDISNVSDAISSLHDAKDIDSNAWTKRDGSDKPIGTRHGGESDTFDLDGKKVVHNKVKGGKEKDLYNQALDRRRLEFERRTNLAREKGWELPAIESIPLDDFITGNVGDGLKKKILDYHAQELKKAAPAEEPKPKRSRAKKKVVADPLPDATASSEEVREWLGLNVPEK